MADHPTAASPQFLAFVGAILFVSLVAWMGALLKLLAGQPLIPYTPRRPTPWGLGDGAIVLGGWLVLTVLCSRAALSLLGDPAVERIEGAELSALDIRNLMLGTLVANLVAWLLGSAWLYSRGAGKELRWRLRDLIADLKLGAQAFALAAAPVYGLQMILTQFFPSNHPAVVLLAKQTDPWTVAVVVISAAVVAPLAEEFLFRLVLQGALEGAEWRALGRRRESTESPSEFAPTPPAEVGPYVETVNPYAASAAIGKLEGRLPDDNSSPRDEAAMLLKETQKSSLGGLPAGVWPIVASSSFFALLHLGHGPDPIPLVVFAAMLGYVYRQTHRLAPSIVTHLLLNSCSLVIFWLSPS